MEVTFKQKPESCKVSGGVFQAGESVQRPWGGGAERGVSRNCKEVGVA